MVQLEGRFRVDLISNLMIPFTSVTGLSWVCLTRRILSSRQIQVGLAGAADSRAGWIGVLVHQERLVRV